MSEVYTGSINQLIKKYDNKLKWNWEGKYQFARLIMGKTKADKLRKKILFELIKVEPYVNLTFLRRRAVIHLFEEAKKHDNSERVVNFILKKPYSKPYYSIIKVSSERHNLMGSEIVLEITRDLLDKHDLVEDPIKGFDFEGILARKGRESDFGGIQYGLSIYPGSIAFRALKISSYFKVESCTNPLAWIGGKIKTTLMKVRVLRLTNVDIRQEIDIILGEAARNCSFGKQLFLNKNTILDRAEWTKMITMSFRSYKLPKGDLLEIIDGLKLKNNVYDIAMKVSNHAVTSVSTRSPITRAKMSSFAVALLCATDFDTMKNTAIREYDKWKSG